MITQKFKLDSTNSNCDTHTEKEQTEVKKSIGQPSKLVATDKTDKKPPQNKQADGEKLVAPHDWLSVYDNKNTDSS